LTKKRKSSKYPSNNREKLQMILKILSQKGNLNYYNLLYIRSRKKFLQTGNKKVFLREEREENFHNLSNLINLIILFMEIQHLKRGQFMGQEKQVFKIGLICQELLVNLKDLKSILRILIIFYRVFMIYLLQRQRVRKANLPRLQNQDKDHQIITDSIIS